MPGFNKANAVSRCSINVINGDIDYPYFHEAPNYINIDRLFDAANSAKFGCKMSNIFFDDTAKLDLSDLYFVEHDLSEILLRHLDCLNQVAIRLPYDVHVFLKP